MFFTTTYIVFFRPWKIVCELPLICMWTPRYMWTTSDRHVNFAGICKWTSDRDIVVVLLHRCFGRYLQIIYPNFANDIALKSYENFATFLCRMFLGAVFNIQNPYFLNSFLFFSGLQCYMHWASEADKVNSRFLFFWIKHKTTCELRNMNSAMWTSSTVMWTPRHMLVNFRSRHRCSSPRLT